MALLDLPPDLLLSIADFLPESALNALLQTNSSLYFLNNTLYRHNVRYSHSSALFWASLYGHEPVVRRLLSRNADVNTTTIRRGPRRGFRRTKNAMRIMADALERAEKRSNCVTSLASPLVHAAAGGYVDIMEMLIQHGADIHATTLINTNTTLRKPKRLTPCHCLSTPIMTAANHGHVPAIELLLHHGVDINVPQAACNSPLSLAAIHGHIPAVRTLLHHGADVNTIRRGTTPLVKVIQANQLEATRVLITEGNADLTITSHHPQLFTPVFWAVSQNNPAIISLLLNHAPAEIERRDSIGRTPLALAVWEEHIEAIECLLSHGADINAANRVGQTPLWWALLSDSIPATKTLLTHGADTGALAPLDDESEVMPVLLAAMKRFHYGLVEVLLEHGVNPNCQSVSLSGQSGKEMTPLSLAVGYRETSLVRKLLQHGADPNARSGRCDSTLLYHAIAAGHVCIATMLLDHGADPNALVKLTGKRKGKISPLCWALKCRQFAIARCLVDHGADLNERGLLVKAVSREDVGLTMAMLRNGARQGVNEALNLARVKRDNMLEQLLTLMIDE